MPARRKTAGRRKAVSSLVAVMLLIAMVVVASSALYAYSVGLLGSLQQPAQHGSEILVIEDIAFVGNACKVSPIDCTAYITVRNVGSIDSMIGAIYVDSATKYGPNGAALIAVGQAQIFTLPNVTNTQHNFRVATLNGSVFSTYGPQNIFIVGTFTTTTITTTTTSTYATTVSTQTTLYSTQVGTTSTSTSMTTLSTTSTSLSTSKTSVATYYTTYSTTTSRSWIGYPQYTYTYTTIYYSSPTSTSISTSITTYQTTYATTTSAVTTSYFTTATGTTPTQTITSPVTTVVTTTITTTTGSGISSILLFLFMSMGGFLGLREKLFVSQPRKR